MIKRIVAALFITFFLFQVSPPAQAVEIPTLTWERGKEQSVVMGAISAQEAWKVKLLRPGSPQVTLGASSLNSSGFAVYSAVLPENLPLGEYTVYVFRKGIASGTQVAQVTVTEMKRYSITEIPKDLLYFLLSLIFILTALSVVHGAGYLNFVFLRQKTLIENQTLLFAKSVPRVIYPIYLLRAGALSQLRPTIFKYLLSKDETLIHKSSPLLWSLLPGVGLVLGLHGGLISQGTLASIPIYSLMSISLLGFFDSFSGVFALLGFAIGQIVKGEVLDLRSALVVSSLGLSWVVVGFLSEILVSSTEQEQLKKRKLPHNWLSQLPSLVFLSLVTGGLFYSALLLTQSLSVESTSMNNRLIAASIVIGCCVTPKAIFHKYLDRKISRQGSSENLVLEEFKAQRLFTPMSAAVVGLLAILTCFIWTTSLGFSVLVGGILLTTCTIFSVQFRLPKLTLLRNWQRDILIESAIVTYLGYLLFLVTRRLPFNSTLKSEIFLIVALSLPLLHHLVSALRPTALDKSESHK